MIEQIWATRLRLAQETFPGSGVANGSWVIPPCTAASYARNVKQLAERKDVFRQPRDRDIVSQSWQVRTAHEVGADFMVWLMLPHLTFRGDGVFTLDPEAFGPTYVLECESQAGDRLSLRGLKLAEMAVQFEEMRIVSIECAWVALSRNVVDYALPAGAEMSGKILSTNSCVVAAVVGAWGSNPASDNKLNVHGGQVIMNRQIDAQGYSPDGVPTAHTRRAWSVLGEIMLPPTPGITDVAFDDIWMGKMAFFFSDTDVSFYLNNAQGFTSNEDIKGSDFRAFRIAYESFSDTRRAILETHFPAGTVPDNAILWMGQPITYLGQFLTWSPATILTWHGDQIMWEGNVLTFTP